MNEIKTAYFAGLIDGEGNIGAYPQRALRRIRPAIKVNMTSKETVEALAAYFGGTALPRKVRVNEKPQWTWQLTYNKALHVLAIIRPYLITKAAAADRVLATRRTK